MNGKVVRSILIALLAAIVCASAENCPASDTFFSLQKQSWPDSILFGKHTDILDTITAFKEWSCPFPIYRSMKPGLNKSANGKDMLKTAPPAGFLSPKAVGWTFADALSQLLQAGEAQAPPQAGSPQWYLERSAALGDQEKSLAAIDILKEGLAQTSEETNHEDVKQMRCEMAILLGESRQWDEAIPMIQSLTKDYPEEEPRMTFNLGLCYQQKGEFDTAISTYTGLIDDATNAAQFAAWSKACLAECKFSKGDQQDAFSYLAEVRGEDKDPEAVAGAAFSEGYLNFLLRKHDKAIPLFEQVISEYPDFKQVTKAKELVGLALLDQKRISDARAWYSDLKANDPDQSRWDYFLAYCTYREGNWAAARDAMQSVCDNYPESELFVRAEYYLGDCYCSLGDNASGAAIFAEIVDEFPQSSWFLLAQARLSRMPAQPGRAGAVQGGDSR